MKNWLRAAALGAAALIAGLPAAAQDIRTDRNMSRAIQPGDTFSFAAGTTGTNTHINLMLVSPAGNYMTFWNNMWATCPAGYCSHFDKPAVFDLYSGQHSDNTSWRQMPQVSSPSAFRNAPAEGSWLIVAPMDNWRSDRADPSNFYRPPVTLNFPGVGSTTFDMPQTTKVRLAHVGRQNVFYGPAALGTTDLNRDGVINAGDVAHAPSTTALWLSIVYRAINFHETADYLDRWCAPGSEYNWVNCTLALGGHPIAAVDDLPSTMDAYLMALDVVEAMGYPRTAQKGRDKCGYIPNQCPNYVATEMVQHALGEELANRYPEMDSNNDGFVQNGELIASPDTLPFYLLMVHASEHYQVLGKGPAGMVANFVAAPTGHPMTRDAIHEACPDVAVGGSWYDTPQCYEFMVLELPRLLAEERIAITAPESDTDNNGRTDQSELIAYSQTNGITLLEQTIVNAAHDQAGVYRTLGMDAAADILENCSDTIECAIASAAAPLWTPYSIPGHVESAGYPKTAERLGWSCVPGTHGVQTCATNAALFGGSYLLQEMYAQSFPASDANGDGFTDSDEMAAHAGQNGDLNGDGETNEQDALYVLATAGDPDGDGEPGTEDDALFMVKLVLTPAYPHLSVLDRDGDGDFDDADVDALRNSQVNLDEYRPLFGDGSDAATIPAVLYITGNGAISTLNALATGDIPAAAVATGEMYQATLDYMLGYGSVYEILSTPAQVIDDTFGSN